LDAALSSHLAMDATPDLLLLPSDLTPFAKGVSQRGAVSEAAEGAPMLPAAAAAGAVSEEESSFVALNPGRLAKGNIGGTLAHVYISEGAPDPAAGGAQPHALHRRARVDIVRI
jgi:DNA polymerase alpha subunit B